MYENLPSYENTLKINKIDQKLRKNEVKLVKIDR